jgi:uncharacterized protein YjbI with pentapeptide repeats
MKVLFDWLQRSGRSTELDAVLDEVGAWACPPELRTRWDAAEPDGTPHRDAVLSKLRDAARSGAPHEELADLRGADLIDVDLSGLDLSGADLRGTDLSRANLERTRLFRADLRGAVLFQARAAEADFTGADLRGANLESIRAHRAGFGRARLIGARMIGADLRGATFTGVELVGAQLCGANLCEARMREADLRRTDFARAEMESAELAGSDVTEACFDGADLRGSHVKQLTGYAKASWIGADVREVDFAGAFMTRRFIMDQNFLEEFKQQGPLSRAVYALWWFSSDCGRSMMRWSLCTLALTTVFAFAFTFVEIDYGDYRTWFSPFYFSVVTLTTLGYGDVLPASVPAQMVVTLEVAIGYMMLGGLISILSNKLARRAE